MKIFRSFLIVRAAEAASKHCGPDVWTPNWTAALCASRADVPK